MSHTTKDYVVERKLGSGTFGVVWLVRKRSDQKLYALKITVAEGDNHLGTEQEYALVTSLPPHPAIIRYYGLRIDGRRELLTMEYAPGYPLSRIIDCAKSSGYIIEKNDLITIARHLLSGLSHLHSHKLAHQDVKPDNIIVDKCRMKFIDLGILCRVSGAQPRCHAKTGTPVYGAPEIWYGDARSIDFRKGDVYSLGVVLFQLAAAGYGDKQPWPSTIVVADIVMKRLGHSLYFSDKTVGMWQRVIDYMLDALPDPETRELLRILVVADPKKRLTADEAIQAY